MNRPLKVYGYVRLSREDKHGAGTDEEKLADRARICLDLAKKNGLPLREEDVLSEIGSGTSLKTRPCMLRLLEMARCGEVTHIITPYQDRLTRGGDADRGAIKEALIRGQVTVITVDGVIPFDRDFGERHELLFDIKAAVGAHYVRDIIQKRKESDRIRLLQGKRSRASAPYGFRIVTRRDVLEGRHPADELGKVMIIPEEFEVLKEILRRIKIESATTICRDLESRDIPPPSTNRPGLKGSRWYASTLYAMLRNPFYAGYLSQRLRVERGRGKVRLRPEEYIISEVQGDWPTLITMEEYYQMENRIQGHKQRAAPRTGLLTGLVHCPNGQPMVIRTHDSYGCDCDKRGMTHLGMLVSGQRLHRWVRDIIQALIDALPADALPTPRPDPQNRVRLQSELMRSRRDLAEKQQQTQDMILREEYFVSLLGRPGFEETARRIRREREALEAKVGQLEAEASVPDGAEALSLLQRIQRIGGMGVFWEEATREEQMALIRSVIRRIDLVQTDVRYCKQARAVLWDWAATYLPELPPFPKLRCGGTNNQNLLRGRQRGNGKT